jgi:transposase-like protein
MGELNWMEELFAGRHFDREIIVLCVRWYLRYKLSLHLVPRQIPSGREMAAILELKAVLQRFFDWGSKYFPIMRSDRTKVERPAA